MAVGLSLGLVFGLALFDNAGLGLAIGVALGAALGSGQDAKAKKDDRLI
ncbi:MAG: glycine zipper family protein [Firmicutes bacterium]|nr:glycine zipper family protein [Bacillota bacterium]